MKSSPGNSGSNWGFLLGIGGVALCCGVHVLALGGLAAVSGILADLGGLIVFGVVIGGIGLWLYYRHRQKPGFTQATGSGGPTNAPQSQKVREGPAWRCRAQVEKQ